MVDKFLKYLTYGNQFCGVEYTSKNGLDYFYATVLKQKKKELVEDTFTEENSISDLATKLPKQQHIHLVVNTSKILVKTIESEQQDDLKLLYKAFPNIDVNDFYYEVLSQGNKHFVSLCRKDYINTILKNFSEHKLNVIDLSLGHSIVGLLIEFVSRNVVYSSDSVIKLSDKKIDTIEKTEPLNEHYHINGLEVSNAFLLSFAGAIQSALKISLSKSNFIDKREVLLDDFKQTRFFNQFLKFGSVFILVLLLINFLFFNHYFSKVNELSQISELNQSTKIKIIALDDTVSKKKKMIDDILKSNASKSSFYSDRIITSLPSSILLSELNYQPLLKRINKDKAIELSRDVITVSGTSNRSAEFSEWVNSLENFDWINSVDIVEYGTEKGNISDFEVKLMLNND